MLILAMLLAAPSPLLPPCRAERLRLTLDGRDGEFNGMSHSGTELSIRNTGPDCILDALPNVQILDARNRPLPAVRHSPRGMHPGPVIVPIRLAAGHRATTAIRWVAGPVFDQSQSVRATKLRVGIGTGTLTTRMTATLYGERGQRVTFEQPPLRAVEGMPAN
ncbi:MAG: DUF4232 domain-containing protein [Sphingomonas phyllosphaerae]|uniref:DUF4232 domain-containing protein n=1 Tax=Sphingomonas phyllosphaerae TaxID=257003 RepID=UPI002FFB7E22